MRIARAAERAVDALAIAAFAGMFVCVLGQVILRYVFGQPLTWSDELARYLLVWCSFLGWIIAARRRSHLAIAVFAQRSSVRGQAAFALVSALAVIAFCIVLMIYGVRIVERNLDVDTVALFFPFAIVYAIVPVSALAIALYAVTDATTAWRLFRAEATR